MQLGPCSRYIPQKTYWRMDCVNPDTGRILYRKWTIDAKRADLFNRIPDTTTGLQFSTHECTEEDATMQVISVSPKLTRYVTRCLEKMLGIYQLAGEDQNRRAQENPLKRMTPDKKDYMPTPVYDVHDPWLNEGELQPVAMPEAISSEASKEAEDLELGFTKRPVQKSTSGPGKRSSK